MRLNCPNCGTGYDVPDGMISPAGRHVQCTDCHTRWFVRGAARPVLSEEQIITRLEARARPRPVPDPLPAEAEPAPAPGEEPAVGFVWEGAGPATTASEPDAEPSPPPKAAAPTPAAPPARPADRPPVPQPRPLATPPARVAAEQPAPPARPAPRIDLTADGAEAPATVATPNHYLRGLTLALGIFLLALVAYRAHEGIAARLPAVAPALEAYSKAVDALRQGLASTLRGAEGG